MSDASQNYRRAFALNAVASNMATAGRSVFNSIDAETVWAIAGLLDQHASVPAGVQAEHTTDALDDSKFDAGYVNPSIARVAQILDEAA